jgi:hypothetical protein
VDFPVESDGCSAPRGGRQTTDYDPSRRRSIDQRENGLPNPAWRRGPCGDNPLQISILSERFHYCVGFCVAWMGISRISRANRLLFASCIAHCKSYFERNLRTQVLETNCGNNTGIIRFKFGANDHALMECPPKAPGSNGSNSDPPACIAASRRR